MPTLPITPITDYPVELTGHLDENGRLPANILAVQEGSSPTLTMCRTPMRSLKAMDAALFAATGLRLKVTSSVDSYRPLSVQAAVFAQRYTTTAIAGEPSKVCSGVRYWLKEGYASAACPGTSNHGLGLACDFQLDSAGRIVNWLIAHAHEFGFSAELQSEPWHWRYTVGDAIPAATLAYEQGEDDDMAAMRFVFAADVPGIPAEIGQQVHITDGLRYRLQPKPGEINALLTKAGAGAPEQVTRASLPTGYDYARAVAALCGTLDPGEQAGSGGGTDVTVVRAAVRAELDATKLGKL